MIASRKVAKRQVKKAQQIYNTLNNTDKAATLWFMLKRIIKRWARPPPA